VYAIVRPLAERGDVRASAKLAELYEHGRGVRRNNFQAYVWYSLAARAGDAGASTGQSRVGGQLQPMERRQAERLVEDLGGRASSSSASKKE
jgi:TPR repeat protein